MAAVGRRRKKDKHLPQRVYYRRGAYYFVDLKGKWHPLGKDYPDALRRYAAILAANAPTNTIELIIAKYDAEELSTKAPKTQLGRRQEFKSLRKVFGHMRAEDVEPHHVWTYWTARGRTEQARHEIRAFSTLMTYARRIGARTQPNPCFGLQLPQSKSRDRYVTDEEFLLVRGVAPPMVGYAMDLALIAGMDQSTIRKLERRHLTDEGIQFERGKTGVLQLIEWSDELRATVKEILALRPQLRRALICNRKGQPYSLNGFQSQWQRVMRNAKTKGLKNVFHFHDLRAKSASDADSDQEAADRLGHGDARITRKTYRRLPKRAMALRNIGHKP
jgi:integrase